MKIESTDQETHQETETVTPPPAAPAKKATKKGGTVKAATKKAPAKKASAKKASAKKAAAPKKEKAAKSAQAQSGPAMELPFSKLNKVEKKLVEGIYTAKGERKAYTIEELMKIAGAKNSLPVRNALRRPVRGGWIEKLERGTYRLTEKARKRDLKAA